MTEKVFWMKMDQVAASNRQSACIPRVKRKQKLLTR